VPVLAEACGRRVPPVESATAPVALALASDAAPPQDGSGLAAPEPELEPEMAVSVSPRGPANHGEAHTAVVVRSSTPEQQSAMIWSELAAPEAAQQDPLALASDAAPPQDGSGLAAPEPELEPEMAVSVSSRVPAYHGWAHTAVVVRFVRSTTSEQR
jgi:hypothetical protein